MKNIINVFYIGSVNHFDKCNCFLVRLKKKKNDKTLNNPNMQLFNHFVAREGVKSKCIENRSLL